jgi:hypothetical protein
MRRFESAEPGADGRPVKQTFRQIIVHKCQYEFEQGQRAQLNMKKRAAAGGGEAESSLAAEDEADDLEDGELPDGALRHVVGGCA